MCHARPSWWNISLLGIALACSYIRSASGQAGKRCVGKTLGNRGTCWNEVVDIDFGGKDVSVKTYCYAPIASDVAKKAKASEEGTCYIPRSYPCDSDSQCRPGTRCWPNGRDYTYICDLGDSAHTVLDEVATLEIVQTSIFDLIDALQQRDGAFMDTKTGVLSPLLAATSIPIQQRTDYVRGILHSFDSGKVKDMGATSGSGATFMFSGDYRFIAKSVRPAEFVVFADELLPALCMHVDSNHSVDWPKLASSSTTLNVPILAFKNRHGHFLILPAVNALRQEARSLPEAWGKPTLYDVKPLRAHSHQRIDFIQWLAQSQSFPNRINAPESARSQWRVLSNMLYADMELLAALSIVDYSILVEIYEDVYVQDPGPQCVALTGCFSNTSAPCHVMCLNIIDYTLKYDTAFKAIESKIIRQKWDDYETKAKHLASCIGDMGFDHLPESEVGEEMLRFKQSHGRVQRCQIYGDLMCKDVEVAMTVDCTFDGLSGCADPSCLFKGEDVRVCHPFLKQKCDERIESERSFYYRTFMLTAAIGP